MHTQDIVTERVLRRLAALEERRQLRVAVRRILGETAGRGLISEWDIALAYANGGSTLTEAQSGKGRLIVESLLKGTVAALKWAGAQVTSGVKALKAAGSEALDAAGKVLVKVLEAIPGGKEAFEMLKDFTADAADAIKDALKDAVGEFSKLLEGAKETIVKALFEGGEGDSSIVSTVKDLIEKAKDVAGSKGEEIRQWLQDLIDDPVAAAGKVWDIRATAGKLVSTVVGAYLKVTAVKKRVMRAFSEVGITSSKGGMFLLRAVALVSGDMGGEETLTAAGKLWSAAKKMTSGKVDTEHRGRELLDMIPSIVEGLVSGGSAVEAFIRSAVGDPTALTGLMKKAIGVVRQAATKLVTSRAGDVLKSLGIDPEGRAGGAAIGGLKALLTGSEPEDQPS